ncbi:hypothetical protein ACNKHX_11650 [Shigella flexneri]
MVEHNTVVEATWNDVQLEYSLGMEVGYRLIPMVDLQQDGELLGDTQYPQQFCRGDGICRQWCTLRQYGSATCPLSHFDEGVEIGSGDAIRAWPAINPGTAAGTLPCEVTVIWDLA